MSESLNIIFMGTPGFAVESLRVIHESRHNIKAVVTAPDRPAGRGQKLRASEVKVYAQQNDIQVLQPEKLRDPRFLSDLKSFEADLFVIVAFRMLPEVVWSMPSKGTINLHASLLPQYRGAAPINWAIINGEVRSGATTFFINAEIDKGKTIDQVEVDIDTDDNAGDLHDRLMSIGARLLLDTVERIAQGDVKAQMQIEGDSTLKKAPKLNNENRKIDWTQNAEVVHNLIRGLSPYPTAYTMLVTGNERSMCKVYRSAISEESDLAPGLIESDGKNYLRVGTGTRSIEILDLQLAGKKKMGIKDLLNGYTIPSEAQFE